MENVPTTPSDRERWIASLRVPYEGDVLEFDVKTRVLSSKRFLVRCQENMEHFLREEVSFCMQLLLWNCLFLVFFPTRELVSHGLSAHERWNAEQGWELWFHRTQQAEKRRC